MKPITDPVTHRSPSVLLLVLFAAVFAGGCENSSSVSAGPTPVKCQVSLGSTSMMEAAGGTGSFSVTTQPECAWDASTSANWISGLSPASGQGNGTVGFRVAANDGAAARDGSIVVNGQSVVVSQRAPCRYTVTPANQNISANGGAGSVNVATAGECAWSASTDVTWITLTAPLSRSGNATVAFTVEQNAGELRTGGITIAGQRVTVTQGAGAAACNASINPSSQNFSADGGTGGPVTVSVPDSCDWTAVSNASWIAVLSAPAGRGNGTMSFRVAANTGAARTGTITLAGRVFTVSQTGVNNPPPPPACTYSIAPASQNVPAPGGAGTVTVTAGAGCNWTAGSNAPWITITAGATGTGNGVVSFSAAANTGAARSGTLTIAGQTFTVTQAAAAAPPPCTYSIAPPSQNVDANAHSGTVTVTAGAGCAWTAASNAPWLAVTSGATGAGNGPVGFNVAANTGAARAGTISIAGQTFTVTQAAAAPPPPPPPPPCAYSIAPNNQNFPALGGSGTVTVTTGATCAWTAGSNAPWITVTSGASGTGNGSVVFSVAVNVAAARSGTLTIAGQTFTVTQDGAVVGPFTLQ